MKIRTVTNFGYERGPVVVAVDDLQWVDDPSLAWLGYLARRAGDLALLLVLGSRSDDPGGERGELERLVGDDVVQRIALGPLSAAAVGAIVRAQLDADADEAFCAACWELTGGNPLFVRELLAAALGEGLLARGESVPALQRVAPAAVGPSVLARLGRMGVEAVTLARSVAVLDAGAEVALAAQLAGLDPVVGFSVSARRPRSATSANRSKARCEAFPAAAGGRCQKIGAGGRSCSWPARPSTGGAA